MHKCNIFRSLLSILRVYGEPVSVANRADRLTVQQLIDLRLGIGFLSAVVTVILRTLSGLRTRAFALLPDGRIVRTQATLFEKIAFSVSEIRPKDIFSFFIYQTSVHLIFSVGNLGE